MSNTPVWSGATMARDFDPVIKRLTAYYGNPRQICVTVRLRV